ncbi:MAG TPA: hypothetical protein VK935_01690 [Actinomycetospora sp.]|nr:hypothetical protein [Actinomycetospora sp.]
MTVAPPSASSGPRAPLAPAPTRGPGRPRRLLRLHGPAVMAATADVNPGNVAINRYLVVSVFA